jgi:hypothetical protein
LRRFHLPPTASGLSQKDRVQRLLFGERYLLWWLLMAISPAVIVIEVV